MGPTVSQYRSMVLTAPAGGGSLAEKPQGSPGAVESCRHSGTMPRPAEGGVPVHEQAQDALLPGGAQALLQRAHEALTTGSTASRWLGLGAIDTRMSCACAPCTPRSA